MINTGRLENRHLCSKTSRTLAEVAGQNSHVVMLLVEHSGQHLLVHVITIFKATQLKSGCFLFVFLGSSELDNDCGWNPKSP